MIAKQISLVRGSALASAAASTSASTSRWSRTPSTLAASSALLRRSRANASHRFSTKGPSSQASPAAEPHRDHHDQDASISSQQQHQASTSSSSASSSSSSASSSTPASSSASGSSQRSDRRSRFMPYAFATGSPLTRLPTPLPPDVAERSYILRRQVGPKSKAGTPIPALSPEMLDPAMNSLSLGDLSGLTMSSTDETFYPATKAI